MGRSVAAVICASVIACQPTSAPAPMPATAQNSSSDEPLQPLPAPLPVDPKRAAIGEAMFQDVKLSADGSVSCATCHPLDRAGADGMAHSRGAGGAEMPLNTPTVFNVAYNFRFNWNGAYVTLEDEFDAPITRTMGMSWQKIEDALRAEPDRRSAFEGAYPDGVTIANAKDALACYVKTLVTPNARFDAYLRGDTDALTEAERRGYDLFEELGCASCHQGANVGGNLFQRMGVMHDYFRDRGGATTEAELGRFNDTKDPVDRHVFRVPSLRNVAMTAPYFHDGSATTLEQAVTIMGSVQLGRKLTGEQVTLIAGFLRTLTGEHKGRALR